MIKPRNLLWQLPLLFVLTAPFWWDFAAHLLNPKKKINHTSAKAERNIVMDGVNFIQSRDGVEELLLKAKKVTSENDQKVLLFTDANAVLLGSAQSFDITSNEAVYDTEKQIVTLADDVQLVSSDGQVLRTSVLRYLAKYKKIKSAAEIYFSGERMNISGTSFYYDLNSGDFRVGSRVVCSLW
jgi:LPS export ABC transporter protein LptC